MKAGDKLIANQWCGFPDGTTKGNVYTVSRVEHLQGGRIHFFILNDEGKEIFPISTVFKLI